MNLEASLLKREWVIHQLRERVRRRTLATNLKFALTTLLFRGSRGSLYVKHPQVFRLLKVMGS